ncbi:MAG: glycosyltransferase family 4 protein [Sphingorhabdus sp.]
MRIAIATDAWEPQVNGVVRTLRTTIRHMFERGHDIELITPQRFLTVPMPGYREIRLAVAPRFGARRALSEFSPDIVHIATEGPIGWSARAWCLKRNMPFTTAFHTRFPDYASLRTGISVERFWPVMRAFHRPSYAVFAATPGLMCELNIRGIEHTRLWSRGVDTNLFNPRQAPHPGLAHLPRPLFLSVGRVAKEKNLEAFLGLDIAGSKVVVGDGPMLEELASHYSNAHFMGSLQGQELAAAYASADVFVFPSMTDTFGLVIIEALASGVPVAAFPVSGPLDIIGNEGCGPDSNLADPVGALDDDLKNAVIKALQCNRNRAADYGKSFSWKSCTDQFEDTMRAAANSQRFLFA